MIIATVNRYCQLSWTLFIPFVKGNAPGTGAYQVTSMGTELIGSKEVKAPQCVSCEQDSRTYRDTLLN